MRFFCVLRSHKLCRILKCAGREAEVRRIGREKAEFLGELHPKVFRAMAEILDVRFCSNKCGLQEVSIFLDRGLFGAS